MATQQNTKCAICKKRIADAEMKAHLMDAHAVTTVRGLLVDAEFAHCIEEMIEERQGLVPNLATLSDFAVRANTAT